MSDLKLLRNEEILRRKRDGSSYKNLAKDYGLSTERIRQICDVTARRQRNGIYYIPEIHEACEAMNTVPRIYTQIVNALNRAGLIHNGKWKRISRNEFLELRNVGDRLADIFEKAQEIAKTK